MEPVREDIQILLKTRARQESDDLIKQKGLIQRFENISADFKVLLQTVDFTLCPMVNCLFEN